jgi:hypothetical protein
MPLTPQSPFYQPVLEAVLTPVVAMFVQSAFATHNGGSIRNALVHNFGWGQLFMCAVIATVVFFLIRPFAARPFARRIAFVGSLAFFSTILCILIPISAFN